jgi:hypothetical protein
MKNIKGDTNMKRNKLLMAGTLMLALLIGCGGGGGSTAKVTLNDANTLFTAGTFTTARQDYIQLIASQGYVAAVGAGWCDVRLKLYAQADSFFTTIASDSSSDGYAGWSFTAWYNNNAQQVVDRVSFVLRKSPGYAFGMDARITQNRLLFIRASSYLQLQSYAACLADIKVLDTGYAYTLTGNAVTDGAALLQELGTLSSATKPLL